MGWGWGACCVANLREFYIEKLNLDKYRERMDFTYLLNPRQNFRWRINSDFRRNKNGGGGGGVCRLNGTLVLGIK